ncbi:hypothetical protein [Pseudomonas sp.]|uniref:hypothetical protein n=1 Tax=Pseudomonas sp. TaxID=306 RepID=UPI003D0F207C
MRFLNIGAAALAVFFCTAVTADQDMMNTQPQGMQTQPSQDKASNPHIEAREEAKRKHMKKQNEEQWRKDAEQRKESEMKRPERSGN